MADLKGTKTEKNLQEAFAGESQARNKYSYYASVAKKEGYEQLAEIFMETAENEKEHAKLHLKALMGIESTIKNLQAAASGENSEWTEMYPRMAQEAREEGYEDLAYMFEAIAAIERPTRKDISIFSKQLKREPYSRNLPRSPGNAEIADISMKAPRLPSSVQCANIPRGSSRSRRTTTDSGCTHRIKTTKAHGFPHGPLSLFFINLFLPAILEARPWAPLFLSSHEVLR